MTSYAVAIGSVDDEHDGIFGRKQFEHLYCVEWNLIDNPPTGTHLNCVCYTLGLGPFGCNNTDAFQRAAWYVYIIAGVWWTNRLLEQSMPSSVSIYESAAAAVSVIVQKAGRWVGSCCGDSSHCLSVNCFSTTCHYHLRRVSWFGCARTSSNF